MENTGFSIELIAGLVIFVGFIGLCLFSLFGTNRKVTREARGISRPWRPDLRQDADIPPRLGRNWALDAVVHDGDRKGEPHMPCVRAESRGIQARLSDEDEDEWDVESPGGESA